MTILDQCVKVNHGEIDMICYQIIDGMVLMHQMILRLRNYQHNHKIKTIKENGINISIRT